MRSIIVDDEIDARENLANLLTNNFPEVEVVGIAENGKKGIDMGLSLRPDLMFLDVQMPIVNGFDVLESVTKEVRSVQSIFVTAHDHYAIEALRARAIDYIMKPIKVMELRDAIKRVTTFASEPQARHSKAIGSKDKLLLPHSSGMELIDIGDIVRLKAESGYTQIFLKSGNKLLATKPMKHFSEQLDPGLFVRIHNSHIVNLQYLTRYSTKESGIVQLKEGTCLPIASRRVQEFKHRLESYLGSIVDL